MRRPLSSFVPLLAAGALLAGACNRDTSGLDPEPLSTDGTVFVESFGRGVSFQGFLGSNTNALTIDANVRHAGTSSIRLTVPVPTDPAGSYAGGAFVAEVPRDLTGFDALTFWAKASRAATLNVAGLGNDNTGTSKFTAEAKNLALTTEWKKFVLPIPLASKLTAEKGLFYVAEGSEDGTSYDIWFDDIKYEKLGTITNPRAALAPVTVAQEVGTTYTPVGGTVTFSVSGTDQAMTAAPGYFTFISSRPAVATVGANGVITMVGAGTTDITATLGTTAATGKLTLNAITGPTAAAPTPTRAAADVISLFSDAYTNVPVRTWSAEWDNADVADVQVGGNAAKKYTNLSFAGIDFTNPTVNATTMTHLHMDVWVHDASAFKIKLVDFGANGTFDGGGDDREHEITLSAGTTPAITPDAWSSLDIPLSAFTGLTTKGHLAQMIISGASSTVYLDNVYFYRGTVVPPSAPATAAPTPTYAAGNVISLFSNAYTNVAVNTWSADWDQADVADVQIVGNDTKKYTNLVFAGIEFTGAPINATTMTHVRMDIWTPDATGAPATFKVKLVDFGANGVPLGGDDVEHEITFTAATTPALTTGGWVTLDIPLSAFTGLTTRAHLAQLIISGDLRTVYVDNVLFHK